MDLDAKPVVAQHTTDLRCYCAVICAPPTPLFRSNPASGPLLVLLHRPPPPHSALPPLSPPSPPLPGAYATALTADLGVLLRGYMRPPLPPSFASIPPRGPYTTSRKLRPTPDLPGPSSVHFLRPLSPTTALPPLSVCPRLHTRPTAPHGCTHTMFGSCHGQ